MVWGAVRSDGKRMSTQCSNRVDSNEYRRILNLASLEMYNSRFIFQKDGAPCHGSQKTIDYLNSHSIRSIKNWPAQSIIKNVW